jgi:hypothetical protein
MEMGEGGRKMLEAGNSRSFQRIFLSLITAAICLFFMQPAVFAAEKVDQSNLPEWAGGWTHINPDPNGQARMWQTFTPNYSTITAVEIDILTVNPGDFDDIITVEIAKDGDILTSTERNVEYGYEGLLRFEFDEAVAVVPGELYELKVHDTGLTRFGWKYAANTYDAGSRYVSASKRVGSDWLFQTYSLEPRIIYVDDDAAGANDGTSWENAYIYLQEALADADDSEKPVEIRVAQGVYKPDQKTIQYSDDGRANYTLGNRNATFQLINDVTIVGGYAGLNVPDPNIDPNTRDIELYKSILSGDLNGNDIDQNNPEDLLDDLSRTDNSYHIVASYQTDETAVLDGFTITGGNANGQSGRGSAPTVGGVGGGMYNIQSNPTVTNCTFQWNSASIGGGMFNEQSSPIITNCTFCSNSVNQAGGGMHNVNNSNPILTNCTFNENFSPDGGGIYSDQSNLVLIDCKFIGNSAMVYGGGMHNMYNNLTLTNCSFTDNHTASYGGGMSNFKSIITLINCNFSGNNVSNTIPMRRIPESFMELVGGGMYNGDCNLTLTNCSFTGNRAEREGSGIYNWGSNLNITNCTFAGNTSARTGALAFCSSSYEWDNSTPSNVQIVQCILWDDGEEIWNNNGSTININYSDIQGGWSDVNDPCEAIVWGEGNIDEDPLFASPGYWVDANDTSVIDESDDPNAIWINGDYHLKSEFGIWDPNSQNWVVDDVTSPCIDAGDPNSPVGDEPEPNGGRVNMGAYGGTEEASKSNISESIQAPQELILTFRFKAVK